MAGINCCDLILIDTWPGIPNTQAPTVANGFDSTQAGNRAASGSPIYQPGTKQQGFQDSTVGAGGTNVANKGYYTMLYAQFTDWTDGGDCSAGRVCTLACGSAKCNGELNVCYEISAGCDVTVGGPCAIACTSVARTEYGWFWVSGVCPNYDVSSFDDIDEIVTDGNVTTGALLTCAAPSDGTVATLAPAAADATGAQMIIGYALADDS